MKNSIVHIGKEWQELIDELKHDSEWRTVYVLGGIDYGKTTLCRTIIDHLISGFSTAYIDCDSGQSVVGPPSTIGMEMQSIVNDEAPVKFLRFIGSTSPVGHMLQTLTGIKRLAEKAFERDSEKIVIDSSGFVLGKLASEFQFQTIDILRPDYLIAIQKEKELEHILANFRTSDKTIIRRVPVSPSAVRRTPQYRESYRMRKLNEYFKESTLHEINFISLGFHGFQPDMLDPMKYRNLLIALCDQENFVVTLGIVKGINVDKAFIQFSSPSFDVFRVTSIQFGSLYLSTAGRHGRKPGNLDI